MSLLQQREGAPEHLLPFQHLWKPELQLHNVAGLKLAVAAGHDIKGNSLTLIERLVAIHLDFREVNEQILAVFLRNEAVALFRVEPLNSTFRHCTLFPFPQSGGPKQPRCMAYNAKPFFFGLCFIIRYLHLGNGQIGMIFLFL